MLTKPQICYISHHTSLFGGSKVVLRFKLLWIFPFAFFPMGKGARGGCLQSGSWSVHLGQGAGGPSVVFPRRVSGAPSL